MSGPLPPADPPGPPGGPPGPHPIARFRAVVLVGAAVVLGILLLQVGSRPGVPAGSGSGATTTTTTAPSHPTTGSTTTTTAAPNPNAKVLVANGSPTTGAATFFTNKLKGQGWTTLPPTNASTSVGASAVYYATGQEAAASAVATALGLKASAVQPLTSSVPVPGVTGAAVVVVVGPDLGPQVTTTTTTTAAPSGTAGASSAAATAGSAGTTASTASTAASTSGT